MYLKSVSMQGFKSFAKKVNLDLTSPATGVVGPNGSGKSNVAEAIRFVLGEQSMKGLRTKSSSDLIFKGSSTLSPLSRASVSIHLDNKEKKINDKIYNSKSETSSILSNFINLDEIILTREIFSDGVGEYLINGTKVRLKDVQELLAMVNISVAGHTIVNQGEADRVLLANSSERREMIEDALGLRIYHMRIKEGEKKLEKVKSHLKEIEIIRKANVPHLNYLRKQVKELEKREEEIGLMDEMLSVYLFREDKDIEKKKKELEHESIDNEISSLETKLHTLLDAKKEIEKKDIEEESNKIIFLREEIKKEEEKLFTLTKKREEMYSEILNLEVEIRFLIKKEEDLKREKLKEKERKEIADYFINKNKFYSYKENRNLIWNNIFNFFGAKDYIALNDSLERAKENEISFLSEIEKASQHDSLSSSISIENENQENLNKETELLNIKLSERKIVLERLEIEKEELLRNIENKKIELSNLEKEDKNRFYRMDNDILEVKLNLEKLYSAREIIKNKEEALTLQELNFDTLIQDMSSLIGGKIFKYKTLDLDNIPEIEKMFYSLPQPELSKRIERSKIRIEESGVINAREIISEYENLSERDEFLIKEITDLEESRANLENLIQELKDTLLNDFNIGLEKINHNFNHYFNEVFPGGKASLSLEKIVNKNKIQDIEKLDESLELEEKEKKEPGIEISVNLPEKKVKDLQMLSGGERALSSIALIFAMSSINHPPFMVLDETDAALDESNARKYGKMIRRLSEKSKLLIITHNRETMNQCDVLYGVTIGSDGSSKLLSIKFDEATSYAK